MALLSLGLCAAIWPVVMLITGSKLVAGTALAVTGVCFLALRNERGLRAKSCLCALSLICCISVAYVVNLQGQISYFLAN